MRTLSIIGLLVAVLAAASVVGSAAELQLWGNTDLWWSELARNGRADRNWEQIRYAVVQSEVWAVVREGPVFVGTRIAPIYTRGYREAWDSRISSFALGGIAGAELSLGSSRLSFSGWFTREPDRPEIDPNLRAFTSVHFSHVLPVSDEFSLQGTLELSTELASSYEWLEVEIAGIARPSNWLEIKLGGFLGMVKHAGLSYPNLYLGVIAGATIPLRPDVERPLVPLLH